MTRCCMKKSARAETHSTGFVLNRPSNPLKEPRTLLFVRVGSSQEKSLADPRHTLTFACRYRLNVSLQA